MQSQKKNAQLHCNDSTFSLQLRPTPFVQKTSSVRGRMENGSYSINRREIHQFVRSCTEANVQGKNGVTKTVFGYLRFVVSLRLMSSLDKLVFFLPVDNFSYLHRHFRDYSVDQKRRLHREGVYPYTYFDDHVKFVENFFTTVELLEKFSTSGRSKHQSRRMESR